MKIYKPEQLNKILNTFKWGCYLINDNKPYNVTDSLDNWYQYKVLTPKQFLLARGGCCWDYVNFEYYYFTKYLPNINIHCYYIEDEINNHTWLTYELNDKIYLFESSWKNHIGIYQFNTNYEMLNYYIQLQYKENNNKSYIVYEYIPKSNLSCEKFIIDIFKNGKLIMKDNNYYNKYIKPLIDNKFTDLTIYFNKWK